MIAICCVAEWVVTTLDLAALLQFMTDRDAAATAAGTAHKYLAPIDLATILSAEDGIADTASPTSDSSDAPAPTTSLTAKTVLDTNHILHHYTEFRRTTTSHSNSILLGYMYCIVDRVFVCTALGDLLLFNAAKNVFYGAVVIPEKFISREDDGHVVSCYCDVVSDPSNPALRLLTNEGHLLRVALKGAAAVARNKGD